MSVEFQLKLNLVNWQVLKMTLMYLKKMLNIQTLKKLLNSLNKQVAIH